MDMTNVFENAGAVAPADGDVQVVGNSAESAKKKKLMEMRAALRETKATDPTYESRVRTLSESVEVINTLGYSKGENIIEDKKGTAKSGTRCLKKTSKIVGYKFKNNGDAPIEYKTEVWTKDEATGKYVGEEVTRNIAPGEVVSLNRKYFTMFCARPEISFVLANGKIVASSGKNSKSVADELASYYFMFDRDETGATIPVNDDEVKVTIDVDGVVKEEFAETFGYLNNPKERTVRGKGSTSNVPAQELAANYIRRLIEGNTNA